MTWHILGSISRPQSWKEKAGSPGEGAEGRIWGHESIDGVFWQGRCQGQTVGPGRGDFLTNPC